MFEKNSASMGFVPNGLDDMGDKPKNYVDTEDTDSEYTIEVLVEDFAVECKFGFAVDYMATEIKGDK